MILEEIKSIKSGKKELREFGIIIGIALGLLGGLLLWRGRDNYHYLFIIAAVFIFCGLTLPSLLQPLQKAWMTLAVIIGWFTTRIILCILFYLVFTPIGFVSRLLGKQFLDLKMDRSKKSYWIYKESKEFNQNGYKRQF